MGSFFWKNLGKLIPLKWAGSKIFYTPGSSNIADTWKMDRVWRCCFFLFNMGIFQCYVNYTGGFFIKNGGFPRGHPPSAKKKRSGAWPGGIPLLLPCDISGDSWMYPYQRTPMGNPYISPIYPYSSWVFMGYYPQESLYFRPISTMGTRAWTGYTQWSLEYWGSDLEPVIVKITTG